MTDEDLKFNDDLIALHQERVAEEEERARRRGRPSQDPASRLSGWNPGSFCSLDGCGGCGRCT